MSRALLKAADFKRLIAEVTRLPSVGAFAGSELIHLRVGKGVCTASTFGVVLSVSQVPAKGRIELCAVDERVLQPFAVLGDRGQVLIETVDGEIRFKRSGNREVITPFVTGKPYRLVQPEGARSFKLTPELAKKVGYQADIAFSDSSKPELNAVYLTVDGRIIAVNQKCVSVLNCPGVQSHDTGVAIPIPLARVAGESYTVHASASEMLLKNSHCGYTMPAPVKAQKEFPLAAVQNFADAKLNVLCTVAGDKFTQMIAECGAVLGGVAGTEVTMEFSIGNNQIQLHSQNGGAKFQASVKSQTTAEAQVRVPLVELSRAQAFLAVTQQIQIAQSPTQETYLLLPDGWLMFPSYHSGKKKKA